MLKPTDDTPRAPYVAPQITLIGNLRDLVAGGGSQDTDVQGSCEATGPIVDPECR